MALTALLAAGFRGAAFHEVDGERDRCQLAGTMGEAPAGSPTWVRRMARAAGPLPAITAALPGESAPGGVDRALGIGQFYIAIVIAWLVSIYAAGSRTRDMKDE